MSDKNGNDLQTDACPSPPRNTDPDKPFTNNHSEESTESTPHKPSKPKSRSKTAKSSKASNSVKTILNISHSSQVHVGDVHNYVVPVPSGNPVPPESTAQVIRTEAINSLLTSVDLVEEQQIDFVSSHITVDGWTKVAQSLHFSTGQIQQLFKRCESRGIREVVYTMLMEWKQKEPTSATLGELGTVLWENMEQEAVSRLANKLYSTIK